MNQSYTLTNVVPSEWERSLQVDKNLFHSQFWIKVLETAFNANIFYLWNKVDKYGFTVTVFKKGPFKIGYINFPVGPCSNSELFNDQCLDIIKKAEIAHFIRVPSSSICNKIACRQNHSTSTPETLITDLGNWDRNKLPGSVRRNIRKAYRSPVDYFEIREDSYAEKLFQLYENTIIKHGGRLRYNKSYFRLLSQIAASNELLRISGIRDENGNLTAFIAVAYHEQTAFYLHGGMNTASREYRPMYLLFYEAINSALNDGLTTFNMMSSPPKQPGLIRFKEQWNAVTKNHHVYDFILSHTFGNVISCAFSIKKLITRLNI